MATIQDEVFRALAVDGVTNQWYRSDPAGEEGLVELFDVTAGAYNWGINPYGHKLVNALYYDDNSVGRTARIAFTPTLNKVYVLSAYIQMVDRSLPVHGVTDDLRFNFDTNILTELSIDLVPNTDGIYRLSAYRADTAGVAGVFQIRKTTSNTDKPFYLSGIMLEEHDAGYVPIAPAPYVETVDGTVTPKLGIYNDLVLAHWQSLIIGTAPDDINEALYAYLVEQGQSGALNDAAFAWLDGLGYSGSLNEKWLQYWEAQP